MAKQRRLTKEEKERLRGRAWAHAVDYGTFNQGKFFLIFPNGRFSEPLDDSNIPNKGWEGAVGRAYFENPYDYDDWGEYAAQNNLDLNDADPTEFIENIKNGMVPDSFDVEFTEDDYSEPVHNNRNKDGICGEGFHWVKGYNKVVYEGATRGSTVMAHVKGHCAKNPRLHRRKK